VKTALIKVAMSLGVVLAGGLGIATTASAQTATAADCTYSCATVPTVPSISSSSGSTTPAAVATDPVAATPLASTSSTSLAFTGADVGGTLGVAGVLVGGGIVLVRVGRRKRSL
jgi:hypothetical protein